ncbi:hypothetical protein FRC02_001386 [Tulasnella sp. 418]|nr:hypothetical protein FRC02_001386 [Tulasnella sp. 418]
MKPSLVLSGLMLTVPAVMATVPIYYQCGGNNWTGETECDPGLVCVFQNEWYHQCLPAPSTLSTTASSTTSEVETSTSDVETSSIETSSSSSKTSSSSIKPSSSSIRPSSSSTKTSSSTIKTSTTTSTKTTTSAVITAAPTGLTTALPASSGYVAFATASVISGTFDGGMRRYDRAGSSGDCQGQSETGEDDAVFILQSGATIQNVIIGKAQAEGIHCRGPCTVKNVWWADVCEDAITIKQTGSGDVSYIIGGGAFGADDKIVQHNGGGTVQITNFYAKDFGKLYRSCGNCSGTAPSRHVVLNNVAMINGKEGVGINEASSKSHSRSRLHLLTLLMISELRRYSQNQ